MTPERWSRVSALLAEALELPGPEREAFLAQACAGDIALRREIDSLLSAANDSGSNGGFLNAPARDPWTPVSREGDRIGKYRIRSLLGWGGMGEVYLADDSRLARTVALKLLRAAGSGDRQGTARLIREARAASMISHPNVCVVHDVSDESFEPPFIAMEYVEGESLRARLTRARRDGKRLDLPEAIDLMTQTAAALAAAHAAGVLHRDVKPENLLVRPDGLLKVVDFGLARQSPLSFRAERGEIGDSNADEGNSVRTLPGMIVGTPAYMSPEQLRGLPVDARTDIWSLGAVCYELLAVTPAFSADTHSDLVVAVLERDPAPLLASVPPSLVALVEHLLKKDREMRPADMASVHRSLCAIRDEARNVQRRDTHVIAPSRSQHAAVMLGGLALVVAALNVSGVLSEDPGRNATRPAVRPESLDPKRVLVTAFENGTRDPGFDAFGRLAADWIALGLQSLPVLRVVDPSTAFLTEQADSLAMESSASDSGGTSTAVRSDARLSRSSALEMARITRAGFVASGRFDLVQDSLVFLVRVSDVETGTQHAMLRIGAHRDSTDVLLAMLRQQVGGALARAADERVAALVDAATSPPSLDAYRSYAEGLKLFGESRYAQAIPLFLRAIERDSTFMLPRFWAMFAYGNSGSRLQEQYAMLDATAAYRARMSPLDVASLESFEASRRGDYIQQLAAVRQAASLAPGSNWTYMEGRLERILGNPRRAMEQFLRLDPTRGWVRGWSGYWTERARARHDLGELNEARIDLQTARRIIPDDRTLRLEEISVLAADGRFREVSMKLDSIRRLESTDGRRPVPAVFAYHLAGLEYRAHGHDSAAQTLLDTVASWPTNSASTAREKFYIATALLALDRYEEAEAAFRQLRADQPDDVEVVARLAITLASTGRRAESLQALAAWDSMTTPKLRLGSNGLLLRGICLGLLGDRVEGTELIKTAFARGVANARFILHTEALLLRRMRGYAPFEEVLKPQQ